MWLKIRGGVGRYSTSVDVVAADPDVAVVIVHIAGPHLHLSPKLFNLLHELSQTRSVLHEHLFDAIGTIVLLDETLRWPAIVGFERRVQALSGWQEFQLIADESARATEDRRIREQLALREARSAALRRLLALPLGERLGILLGERRSLRSLEPELSAATDEQIQAIDPMTRHAAVRRIGTRADGAWRSLRERLKAAGQHSQRLRADRRKRELLELADCGPVQRLVHIAECEHRTLSFWPSDWADVPSDDLAAMPLATGEKLVARIGTQAKRVNPASARAGWRELARRLRAR